jgi:hypothetical protein
MGFFQVNLVRRLLVGDLLTLSGLSLFVNVRLEKSFKEFCAHFVDAVFARLIGLILLLWCRSCGLFFFFRLGILGFSKRDLFSSNL